MKVALLTAGGIAPCLSAAVGRLVHNYLHKYDIKMIIDCVYLFEPLICIRACMDTFFSHRRNFIDTFQIMSHSLFDRKAEHRVSCFLREISAPSRQLGQLRIHLIGRRNRPFLLWYPMKQG